MENKHKYNSIEYYIQQLTSKDKEYVATYLNETDETRETAIAEIRRWIDDEMHIQIDDFLILRFLRVCKFNLEKTKARIRNYYKLRSDLPEWFSNTDPFRPELQELINMGLYLPLRKPDNQGRFVVIARSTLHNPRIHKLSDIIKVGVMMVELAMRNRAIATSASVYGFTMINDAINPTLQQFLQFGPSILKKIAHTWQNCYPMRFQLVNVINAPMFLDISFKIFKSFMSEKMSKRIHVYSHMMPSCFEDIPANILPIEYGGTDGTIQELTDLYDDKAGDEGLYHSCLIISGCVLIINLLNSNIYHVLQLGPFALKKIVHTWQNCYPMRIQSINIVHAPMFAEIGFRILRSFISEKMSNRFHIIRYMLPSNFLRMFQLISCQSNIDIL